MSLESRLMDTIPTTKKVLGPSSKPKRVEEVKDEDEAKVAQVQLPKSSGSTNLFLIKSTLMTNMDELIGKLKNLLLQEEKTIKFGMKYQDGAEEGVDWRVEELLKCYGDLATSILRCEGGRSRGEAFFNSNISHAADPRHLEKMFWILTDTECLYFPFPYYFIDETARLLIDFVKSSSRVQRRGQLVVISLCGDPYWYELYVWEAVIQLARKLGYECVGEETQETYHSVVKLSGGAHVLLKADIAGQDATSAFFGLHRAEVLTKYSRYLIGEIKGEASQIIYPTAGVLSTVPYAEPSWLTAKSAYKSPYYTDAHRALALAMREFVDVELVPEARMGELTDKRPSQELVKKMSDLKILHMRLGPGKHLHGLTLPGGMRGEDFDYLAELVVTQELSRMAARGFQDGLSAGMWIGLTPILNYGTEKQKRDIITPVLAGEKHICLAISEAFAGSDVAGIQTTARLTPDGKSDYFTTAVMTSEKGMSMILIPADLEGVDRKIISTSYSKAAGTAYIMFDNVHVPVENIIGEVDKGFKIVLSNFNHERLVSESSASSQA
ncbi:hypothetical protein P7C70_g4507, partial [Phenoliferia sp. Uapishka_3]